MQKGEGQTYYGWTFQGPKRGLTRGLQGATVVRQAAALECGHSGQAKTLGVVAAKGHTKTSAAGKKGEDNSILGFCGAT